MTDALSFSNSGAELHRMIAEAGGAGLIFHFVGGGYGGPYPAAASGDPGAIILRDAINGYVQRLFEVELENSTCLICSELFHDVDVGLVVVVVPIVPAPTCICCAPICTRCWTELPEYGELLHAVAQCYRAWLPDLVITLHPEAGHS